MPFHILHSGKSFMSEKNLANFKVLWQFVNFSVKFGGVAFVGDTSFLHESFYPEKGFYYMYTVFY